MSTPFRVDPGEPSPRTPRQNPVLATRARLSAKLGKFVPSLTLSLKALAQERRRRGLPIYDFGLGETRGELAPAIADAAATAYREGRTQYADPSGLVELRQAVLDWLGLEGRYGADSVVVTTGAKQSLFNIFLALADPGDCFLFDCAPWVSYQPLAVASYASPVMVEPTAGTRDFLKISSRDLERTLKLHPQARLFLLNSPCNPTGQVYSAAEVEELLSVCVEHGVYFVLDRLYWQLVLDGEAFPSPRIDEETLPWVIQVDGLSKNFRRTGGLRIGWTVAPADVARAMTNLQSHYTSGPSVPAQHAALAAVSQPYDTGMRADIRRKADLMRREAESLPHVDAWPTVGAFYSFWDVHDCLGRRTPDGELLESSADVAAYLLEAAGLISLPGEAFLQEGYLRLSITLPDEELVAGVRSAVVALERLESP